MVCSCSHHVSRCQKLPLWATSFGTIVGTIGDGRCGRSARDSLRFGSPRCGRGEFGKPFDGLANVEVPRVGVDTHRQLDVGMPHRGLCRSRCGARCRKHRAERRAQRVNVNRPAAVVALRDAGRSHVAVEDEAQPAGNGEQPVGGGKAPLADPLAEFGGQVGAERDRRAGAVLLVRRFEPDAFRAGRQVNAGNGQRAEFIAAKTGVDQGAVDEYPLTPQGEQSLDDFRADVRGALPLPLAAADGAGVVERSVSGHGEQPADFVRGQGAPLPLRVGAFVGFGEFVQVVPGKPAGVPEPVGEPNHGIPVVVPGACPHAVGHGIGEPSFDLVAVDVADGGEAEFGRQPADGAERVRLVAGAHVRGGERLLVGVEVRRDRTGGGAGGVEVRGVENAGGNLFGFLLPLGELLPGVRFVAASGRALDGAAGVILEAGVVGAHFDGHGSRAVVPPSDGCGVQLPATSPAGEPLPVRVGHGGGFWNGSAKCLAEQRAHDCNPR